MHAPGKGANENEPGSHNEQTVLAAADHRPGKQPVHSREPLAGE